MKEAIAAARRSCLTNEFHQLTLRGTVQRASIYDPAAPESERAAFRASLRRLLTELSEHYKGEVAESEHLANISRLAAELSDYHGDALRGRRLRIGPAQKALNLFLKYQWCAGWIAEPPHCPFDAIIINRLTLPNPLKWTELDDLGMYERLIEAARRAAGSASLAVWELKLYDEESMKLRHSAGGENK